MAEFPAWLLALTRDVNYYKRALSHDSSPDGSSLDSEEERLLTTAADALWEARCRRDRRRRNKRVLGAAPGAAKSTPSVHGRVVDSFSTLYEQAAQHRYEWSTKDAVLLARLRANHGEEEVISRLTRFFSDTPKWVQGAPTVGAFYAAWNSLAEGIVAGGVRLPLFCPVCKSYPCAPGCQEKNR